MLKKKKSAQTVASTEISAVSSLASLQLGSDRPLCLRRADVTQTVEVCHSNGLLFWQACGLLGDLTLIRAAIGVSHRNVSIALVLLSELTDIN